MTDMPESTAVAVVEPPALPAPIEPDPEPMADATDRPSTDEQRRWARQECLRLACGALNERGDSTEAILARAVAFAAFVNAE